MATVKQTAALPAPNNAQTATQSDEQKLSTQLQRRGIDDSTWRALRDSVYAGTKNDSILMVIDYCKARKLDPLLKAVHIVPIRTKVRDEQGERWVWRDTVMPGIYLYRTIAHRTGLYLGHDEPEFGPIIEFAGIKAPEWCKFTCKRWNEKAQRETFFPVKVMFPGVVATVERKVRGADGNDTLVYVANERWSRDPDQMLCKCAEAGSLREAFPEELGGTHTDDELAGKVDTGTGQTYEGETVGKPRTTEPQSKAPSGEQPAGEGVQAITHVPLPQIRLLLDQVGISENELLRNFELESLEAMQLKDVAPVMTFLQTLKAEPP